MTRHEDISYDFLENDRIRPLGHDRLVQRRMRI
jgi:hypothetical protein